MFFISSVSDCTTNLHPNLSIPLLGMLASNSNHHGGGINRTAHCLNIITLSGLSEVVWSPVLLSLPPSMLLLGSLVLQHCSFSSIYRYPPFPSQSESHCYQDQLSCLLHHDPHLFCSYMSQKITHSLLLRKKGAPL